MAGYQMSDDSAGVLDGGCTCGKVRYRMTSEPVFVHCCHCAWCQRESRAKAVAGMVKAGLPE